jgi:hypothetical protein
MICVVFEFYLADQIKRDEGAGRVEGMGEGRDGTRIGMETSVRRSRRSCKCKYQKYVKIILWVCMVWLVLITRGEVS